MEPTKLTITAHYVVRARQRGYRPEDLVVIESLGSFYGDGILLRKKDVAPEVERLTTTVRRMRRRRRANGNFPQSELEAEEHHIVRQIERLQRLPGAFIPVESGRVLSIYRPCRRRLKHVLRGGRRLRRDRGFWR